MVVCRGKAGNLKGTFLVALTISKVISGWSMYILWILGFVVANLMVTKVTAKWSYQRRKQKRLQEQKKGQQK